MDFLFIKSLSFFFKCYSSLIGKWSGSGIVEKTSANPTSCQRIQYANVNTNPRLAVSLGAWLESHGMVEVSTAFPVVVWDWNPGSYNRLTWVFSCPRCEAGIIIPTSLSVPEDSTSLSVERHQGQRAGLLSHQEWFTWAQIPVTSLWPRFNLPVPQFPLKMGVMIDPNTWL